MSAHENAWRAAQNQRCWLRTAPPCQLAALYAGFYLQLLTERALSIARLQKSAQKRQHREKMEEETEDAATKYHKRLDTELTRDKK